MIQWWYRLEGTFKSRIAFPVWFRPFRPSDASRLSEQFVTPPSGMVTQVQQLTQGRSALESSARSTVCRLTQVMQGNEILAPTMASMRLQNPPNNVTPVGGFGGVPRPVPFIASATVPYNPEVRINHPVYPQMPTHSPMEIENTPSFPSFCAGMTTPVSSAYITPTMRNSPPPPTFLNYRMLFPSYLDRLQRFNLGILFTLRILLFYHLNKRIGRVNFTFGMNFTDNTSFSSAIITIQLDFLGLRSTIILKESI
jgi:hypothetical protein